MPSSRWSSPRARTRTCRRLPGCLHPTIYFIDTVFAWPLVTCEDPAHPMSRRDDLVWKTKLCLLAKKHFGLFGSEEGREWAVPCADYLEGIFGHQTDSPPGQVIPLFPLVYSDCVQIMTHQGNRIGAGDEKKVADHILFAEMFLPSFGQHLYWQQTEPAGVQVVSSSEFWSRGDGGWGEALCRTDRVIKNVWEVLSPLNRMTAELPLDDHKFLTPDRLVQQTRFGDVMITVAFEKPADIGDHRVPANGFIVESPLYVAFCATRYNGVDYASPTLFTAQSLDGQPTGELHTSADLPRVRRPPSSAVRERLRSGARRGRLLQAIISGIGILPVVFAALSRTGTASGTQHPGFQSSRRAECNDHDGRRRQIHPR